MALKKLQVYTRGNPQNPALLFVHAFPFPADLWKEQIDLLSEKFYCVAPNLPGFGESPLPEHAFTFEYYVDLILNFLKESKIEKAVFCGLSMGGYLALRLYEREPGLCRALILCDTKAGADGNEAKAKRWKSIEALQKSRIEFMAAHWQAVIGESSKKSGTLKMRFDELVAQVSNPGIAAALVALTTRTDSTTGLSKIRVPTLILVGEEDTVTPVSESEAMAKAISGSQLKILAKTGHMSNLENPREFNESVAGFLSALK